MKLAQGIQCGPWALAFGFDWARQIVDRFEPSPVPRAPHWLIGAANIDGNIVPVVDLQAYLSDVPPVATHAQQRLLVGGHRTAQGLSDDHEDALGIAFDGLPLQLKYLPGARLDVTTLPERLRELCIGTAPGADGRTFLEVDTQRLLAALSDELAQV